METTRCNTGHRKEQDRRTTEPRVCTPGMNT
jgi:hypothetical protein